MRAKLLQDAVATGIEAFKTIPSSFQNEAESIAWMDKLEHGVNVCVYDVIKSDAPAASVSPDTLKLACSGSFSDEEIEDAYNAHCLKAGMEKIGDGTILERLKKVDWAALIQMAITLASLIPK